MDDKESCKKWAEAMQEKCKVNSACKIDLNGDKSRCSGAFRAMLMSFRKEEEVPLMEGLKTSDSIGDCFKITLEDAKTCKAESKTLIEDMLKDVNVPSEEMIKKVREQFKA